MTTPETTPQTWPDGTWPTVDEWLPWYDAQTYDARYELAGRVIDAMQTAHRCLTLDHDGAVEQLGRNARRIADLLVENSHLTTALDVANRLAERQAQRIEELAREVVRNRIERGS